MATHTPGPWKHHVESADPEWAIVTDHRGHIVANINSESGPGVPPLVAVKMPRDANARLIAAAPQMLEALKALVLEPNDNQTIVNAYNAIRKATGG